MFSCRVVSPRRKPGGGGKSLWILCPVLVLLLELATFSTSRPLDSQTRDSQVYSTHTHNSVCRYSWVLQRENTIQWFLDTELIGEEISTCTFNFKPVGNIGTRKLEFVTYPFLIFFNEAVEKFVSCGDVTSCVKKVDIPIYVRESDAGFNHGRRLLSLTTETHVKWPSITVVALASAGFLVLVILVLLLCTCRERSDDDAKNNGGAEIVDDNGIQDNGLLNVETGVTPQKAEQNGLLTPEDVRRSHASSSSSHPVGHDRELPELPHRTTGSPLLSDDSSHEYDHLHQLKNRPVRSSNYDHVQLTDADPMASAVPPANNMYAEVKAENIYAGIKDEEENENLSKPVDSGKHPPQKEHHYAKVDGDKVSEKASKKDVDHKNKFQASSYSHYASVKDCDPDRCDPDTEAIPGVDRYGKEDPYSKGEPSDETDPYSIGDLCSKADSYSKAIDDPYNRVNDDPYNDIRDDPYNKLKDDPYNKLRDDPYNTVEDISYQKELEDPYNKPDDLGEKSYDEDPYNSVIEDTYSKVKEIDRDSPLPLNSSAAFERNSRDMVVDGDLLIVKNQQQRSSLVMDENHSNAVGASGVSENKDSLMDEVSDVYATVMKTRRNGAGSANATSACGSSTSNARESNPYILPPEPPRQYGADEIVSAGLILTHQEVSSETQSMGSEAPVREPRYSKVTARESLASVHARQSTNTYEVVLDKENTYATVEGSSGDGVVKRTSEVLNTETASLPLVSSDIYTEIGSTETQAPNPPSLNRLQQMSRQIPNGPSPLAEPEVFEYDDMDYAIVKKVDAVSPKSPLSPVMSNSHNSTTDSAPTQFTGSVNDDVVFNPDYQLVRDCVTVENDSDQDPNYESVDEAKSKSISEENNIKQKASQSVKPQRTPNLTGRPLNSHVYEEVHPSETRQLRTRPLRQHTYEEIVEVRCQKEDQSQKSEEFSERL
ncbi:hypothetical protein ScPMuIL_008848 [Solemya velum]